MKDPRNEHEASRLIQDSGFGRVGKGEPLEWSRPHRAADCFDDEPASDPWLIRAVGLLLIIGLAVVGALWGWF